MRKIGLLFLLIGGCASQLPDRPVPTILVSITLPNHPPTVLPIAITYDQHVVYSFNQSLDAAATGAFHDAASRFVNPIVMLCHGAPSPETGLWTAFADDDRGGMMLVEDLAKCLAGRFPDRDIVLDICNDGKSDLDVPRVWYFRSRVWTTPDSIYLAEHGGPLLGFDMARDHREVERGKGAAGSIWEAVTEGGKSGYEK